MNLGYVADCKSNSLTTALPRHPYNIADITLLELAYLENPDVK